jgi:hypothetical protein
MVQVAALSNVETHSGTAIPQSAAHGRFRSVRHFAEKSLALPKGQNPRRLRLVLTNCALSVIETQTAMGFCLSEFTDQTACGLMIPT